MYDKAYAEKNPIPIDGTIRAPKDPDNSIGEYYLTIRGTRELKIPTQKPWSIRPTSKNEVKFGMRIKTLANTAIKSTKINDYLTYLWS